MRTRKSRFEVIGRLDSGGPVIRGSVTIYPDNVVEIRVHRSSKRRWLTTLDAMVDLAVLRQVRQAIAEKKAARKARRRGRK